MRIVVVPSGENEACDNYRMRWPAAAVARSRPDLHVETCEFAQIRLGSDPKRPSPVAGIADPTDVDVLVVQRPGTPAALQLLRWARSNGTRVVVDNDDALWEIDPQNVAYTFWNRGPEVQDWRNVDTAVELADFITVATDELTVRYGRRRNFAVLPNLVPPKVVQLARRRREGDRLTFGWAGFTNTHPDDLAICGAAVRDSVELLGAGICVIGDAAGAARDWAVPASTITAIPPQRLGHDYWDALARLDVMLVPLRPTHFNECKSWLKSLEAAALGLAVIASATVENAKLARICPGITLASTESEWRQAMLHLAANPGEAVRLGSANREAVIEHRLLVEEQADRWATAWTTGVRLSPSG